MQAVILAAGLGTRMGDLTKETPKPLLKYQGKSFLEHNLLALPDEVNEVIIVVGYLQEHIRAAIGDVFSGKKITYLEQREKKGTGHALSLCKDAVHDRFLVLMGDDIYAAADLKQMVQAPLAILAWGMRGDETGTDRQAGIKINEIGELVDIIERRPANKGTLVNAGAYVLNANFFKYPLVPAGNQTDEFGLPQTMLQMVGDGVKFNIVKATSWTKITSPEDLK